MSTKFTPSKGDWSCSDSKCGNVNFARRVKCNKCGKSRKHKSGRDQPREIGKAFADKSKGLFSADDWQCKSCGNINWARRNTCNVCNTTRSNTQGKRTGYGGGYMERDEIVEYKRRDDSDDEFDEFGLKKKKFRKTLNSDGTDGIPMPTQLSSNNSRYEEKLDPNSHKEDNLKLQTDENFSENEEEESGDENDLAKYAIWENDDEVEEEEKADERSKEDRNPKKMKQKNNNVMKTKDNSEKQTNSSSSSPSSSEDEDNSSSSSSGSSESSTSSAEVSRNC